MKLGNMILVIAAALVLIVLPSRADEPKKAALPTTPGELIQWLPGTIWEMHSAQKHPAGEGYIMFRDDGTILQIDFAGHPVEAKVWAVNPKMLVVWGAANIRIMLFEKDFRGFTDTRYLTTGKRTDDPAVREMFKNAKSAQPRAGKSST